MCTKVHARTMSVKKTSRGTWQARWRDDRGKQRAKTFRTRDQANTFHSQVAVDLRAGTYVTPTAGKTSVRSWADEWLAGARNLSTGGVETYQRDLDRYILPALGDHTLRGLTADDVDRYLSDIAARLAPSTVLRHYRTIRRMCHVAVQRQKIIRNPCDPVTPPRLEPTEMRFLDVSQVEALAAHIGGRYRAWALTASYGGLRWSELVGLQRRRVDGARVSVVDQLVRRQNGQSERTAPKTKAGRRVVTLPSSVGDELAGHIDQWAMTGKTGLVFPNQHGTVIGPSFRGNVFKPAVKKAKLDPKLRPHDLRHTAVALAIAAGAHPKAVQARMGHASITTTLNVYGHLFPDADENVALGLDDLRRKVESATGDHLPQGVRQ